MKYDSKDIAARLYAGRDSLNITPEEMAKRTGITVAEYTALESGERDFSLSFLNACADVLGVELIELLTGTEPRLQKYTVVKNGQGLPIERRSGFSYQHVAYLFKKKQIEPLVVTAPFSEEEQTKPITLSSHGGQEMDYVLTGRMKFIIDGHEEILEPGDCVYYDSRHPHGMIAIDGGDCTFLAILV